MTSRKDFFKELFDLILGNINENESETKKNCTRNKKNSNKRKRSAKKFEKDRVKHTMSLAENIDHYKKTYFDNFFYSKPKKGKMNLHKKIVKYYFERVLFITQFTIGFL